MKDQGVQQYQVVEQIYDIETGPINEPQHQNQTHDQLNETRPRTRRVTTIVQPRQNENTVGTKSYYSSLFLFLVSFIGYFLADGNSVWLFFFSMCISMIVIFLINCAFCTIHERIYDDRNPGFKTSSSCFDACNMLCKCAIECSCVSVIFIGHFLMICSGLIVIAAVGLELYEHHTN